MTLANVPDTMAALSMARPGRPPKLAVIRRPTPTPGPGEVLLRVNACGFCHHDLLVMSGTLRRGVAEGVTLGHEIAGTVVATSQDVVGVQVGDRVVSLLTAACGQCARCRAGREHRCLTGEGIGHGRAGGFAEYVALSATALVTIPDGIPDEEGALLACPVGVALNGVESAGVAAGETVVVTGAGGGLGVHAVQMAAMRGAQVIAVTTSPDKADALGSLGAFVVIDAGDSPDFAEVVMALTDDAGADAVIDTVGSPLWPATLRCLGQYGRLALLGDVSGEAASLRLAEVIFRDAQILGVSGVSMATLRQAVDLASSEQLRPVVSQALPLTAEGAMEAWRLLSERRVLGRVTLTQPLPAGPA
ncbi:MAG: alcohol dehydrogenase catalytic domain-containing protein [Chloroflexota bacterium]|nr:alcohol dehydrogenase catalytic domain-containing protein [Chloroflexota bacterium]